MSSAPILVKSTYDFISKVTKRAFDKLEAEEQRPSAALVALFGDTQSLSSLTRPGRSCVAFVLSHPPTLESAASHARPRNEVVDLRGTD